MGSNKQAIPTILTIVGIGIGTISLSVLGTALLLRNDKKYQHSHKAERQSTEPPITGDESNAREKDDGEVTTHSTPTITEPLRKEKPRPTDPLVATPVNGDPPQPVYKFVLTGGPCAGKTTALSKLSECLRNFGFSVYTVPEAATILFSNGIPFSDLGVEYNTFAFQWSLISLQMSLEENFERMARATNRPSVLICDRGLMDGAAYIPAFWWNRILEGKGLSTVHIREGRYDAIFHLVTAADGAESYYTTANNEARTETPEQAREMDQKTQTCWLGHPHHHVFDNSTDFKGKIQRLLNCAGKLVGLPTLTGTTKKFLLSKVPIMENFPVAYQEFEVEKIYLRAIEAKQFEKKSMEFLSINVDGSPALSPTQRDEKGTSPSKLYRDFSLESTAKRKESSHRPVDYSFVRKRKQNGLSVYQLTIVKRGNDGKRTEVKRMVTEREFKSLVALDADPDRLRLKQKRYSFLWKTQSFQVHVFTHPIDNIAVLHCQAETDEIVIPPFLSVKETIDDDDSMYSGWQVSLKGKSPVVGSLTKQSLYK
mmetsp:Transcript_28248/g.36506  ORF Transcript_28248/g.36506 Transcript_28248/m.36506 type:complete len:539 (+) Transcript_28248:79-1695(+)